MSSIQLDDETLKGRGVIERKKIEEFRIRSLGEVDGDLKEYDGWDGVARLGCVAFRLDGGGKVFQSILLQPTVQTTKALQLAVLQAPCKFLNKRLW